MSLPLRTTPTLVHITRSRRSRSWKGFSPVARSSGGIHRAQMFLNLLTSLAADS